MNPARLHSITPGAQPGAGTTGVAIALLLLVLTPLAAFAHSFSALGVGNGLKARVVPALLIDRQGFLWVGSREGLFRYDGYEPLAFLPDPVDPGTISDSDIRCLHEDQSGTLWVGTYSGGLNRFDRATGEFRRYRHDSGDAGSIADDSILAIADGPEGGLWVATRGGLSRLDRETGRFDHFPVRAADPSSPPGTQVRTLHRGSSGLLWVGTLGGGVSRWNPQGGTFTRFDLARLTGGPVELNDVFSLHEDADGRVWAGTRVGLVLLNPATGEARELPLPWSSEYLPVIMAMAADADSRLWLGTLVHGVLLLNMTSLEWQTEASETGGFGMHLRDQPQMSLAVSQDMVFVGTWGSGVHRTSSHSTNFRLLDRRGSSALRDNNITTVLATAEPGRPWLGTQAGGLQRARVADGAVEGQEGLADDLRSSLILDLVRGGDGQLWAATSNGLYRFDDAGVQTGHVDYAAADPGGLGEDIARSLLPGWEDRLWVGTDGSGLYRIDRLDQPFANYRHAADRPDSLSGNHVTALLAAADGHLWVGTRSNGLNQCRIDSWSCQRFTDGAQGETGPRLGHFQVTSLYRDRDGRIWVGTGNGGLNQIAQGPGGVVTRVRHWTREDGLLDNGVLAVEQDLDDSLWVATRHGLSRLQPGTGDIINYVAESGLPTSLFNPGASAADSRYVYFGSVDGLLSFAKGSRFARRQASSVRIASIERAPPGEPGRPLYWGAEQLAIPYGEVLSIKLAVLDQSESMHEYAYRLDADDPWTPLGEQRQLILHGLAPGEYAFQARGRDVFGSWGESGTLALEIVPPFWMTTGFRALVAVLLVAAALGVHQLRQSALARRAREIRRLGERREQALEEQLGSEAELAVLTPRQKEVLQLIAEGCSTKEIAERLGLSIKTVESHRANLMERLDIHDVPGLVRLAIRARLVSQYE